MGSEMLSTDRERSTSVLVPPREGTGFNVTLLPITGLVLVENPIHGDTRGFFTERFHLQRFREHGVNAAFVQDNHSRSAPGVLRATLSACARPREVARCGSWSRLGRGRRHPADLGDIWPPRRGRAQRHERPVALATGRLRAWILCAGRRACRHTLQGRRAVRAHGRGRHSVERPAARHPVAHRGPGGFGSRRQPGIVRGIYGQPARMACVMVG